MTQLAARVILIAGPTASGKSRLALALAERTGGTVINADSMQVYRELAILTARPAAAEEARVPHRLYGVVPAAEAYSAARWARACAEAIAEAHAEGRRAIVVGGTGLYFSALLDGLSPMPPVPAEVRTRWRERAVSEGVAALHLELSVRDPAMAAHLAPTDMQRIVRALEVVDGTGRSLAAWQASGREPLVDAADALRIVVSPSRADLHARCDARFDAMMESGALDEVRRLLALGLDPGLPAMRALGVRPLSAHLAGQLALAEAAAAAKAETRQYAKRQLTWLRRRMSDWTWSADVETAMTEALQPGGPCS